MRIPLAAIILKNTDVQLNAIQ